MFWVVLAGLIGVTVWWHRARNAGNVTRSQKGVVGAPPIYFEPQKTGTVRNHEGSELSGPGTYWIEYRDQNGRITERVIKVQDVDPGEGTVYLRAYCAQQGGRRTFRADRILTLKNRQTGETIADPLVYFEAQVADKRQTNDDHKKVWSRARPGVMALVWIAEADRLIDPDELDILAHYAEGRAVYQGKRLEFNTSVILGRAQEWRPTLSDAVGAIHKMPKKGAERPLLEACIERLAVLALNMDAVMEKRIDQIRRALE